MRWSSNEVVDEELLQQRTHLVEVLQMEMQTLLLKDFSGLQQSIVSIRSRAQKNPKMLTHTKLKKEKTIRYINDSEPFHQVMSDA